MIIISKDERLLKKRWNSKNKLMLTKKKKQTKKQKRTKEQNGTIKPYKSEKDEGNFKGIDYIKPFLELSKIGNKKKKKKKYRKG